MVKYNKIAPKKNENNENKIKSENKEHLCLNCSHSYLMRSNKFNPIVAECKLTKERFVASTPHVNKCGFSVNENEPIIHEMLYLK